MILVAASLASCRSDETVPGGDKSIHERRAVRLIFVTHGQASDPFWSIVQNGAQRAAEDVGAIVEYQAPESFDMVTMGQLIDAAVASNPDGLVVSIPDAVALRGPIRSALDAGIPVISINSGNDVAEQLGVLVHVGQTEYEAGYAGGERMAAAGIKNAFCVNAEVGNLALDLRCQGFSNAMASAGSKVEVLAVELADPTETKQRILAALTSNPDVDGLFTLGPTGALPALGALGEAGGRENVRLATFDLSPEILTAIENGEIMFAIDQQPYLQGYLPVVLLTLYLRNNNTLANDVLRTGPGFVTAENVAQLRELTRRGTR